jgi:hypothetical protein
MIATTSRSSRTALLAALAVALAAPYARAAEPAAEPKSAEQLANEAYEQHAAGQDADAIASYMKAYEASKAGVILFNVAAIYDRTLHERDLAMEYYRRYLLAPDAEPALAAKANERLTALKHEADVETLPKRVVAPVAAAPAPTQGPTPPAAPEAPATTAPAPATSDHAGGDARSGSPLRTAGFVVGATGLVAVGVSMGLGLVAKGKNDDANAVCNGAACADDRGVSLARDAGHFATASTVTFVAGLALLSGGVAMVLLAPHASDRSGSAARLTIAPQVVGALGASGRGGGVSMVGRF